MVAQAFGFTKLVVRDLVALERFYREVFGLTVVRRVTATEHQYALDEVVLSLGNGSGAHSLIIARYRQLPPPQPGAAWTGFVVADIEATLATIVRLGGSVDVSTHGNPEHGVLAAMAADPEGHLIEVIQILAARPA